MRSRYYFELYCIRRLLKEIMATALSYSRVRYQKLRNLSRFTKILRLQSSRCCQERDNLPEFGSSVLSELSMIDPDLDVGKKLANPIELQKNIEARGLENINIQKLAIKYGRMMKIKQEKDALDQERKMLNNQIQTMIKEKIQNEEIENVKVKARGLREQHDTVVKSLQDVHHEVNLMAFGLPNTLSLQTWIMKRFWRSLDLLISNRKKIISLILKLLRRLI